MTILFTAKNESNEIQYSVFINKIPFDESSIVPFFVAVLQTKTQGEIEWFRNDTFESCLEDVKIYLSHRNQKIISIEQTLNIHDEMENFRNQVGALLSK